MGKLYIDVSSTVKVPFTTGTQRVTQNVVKELLKTMPETLNLLVWNEGAGKFCLLSHRLFEAWLAREIEREELLQETAREEMLCLSSFCSEDTFLEMDAGWGNFTPPRPWLYRELKKRSVKLLVFVHDVIPVTYPQFCDRETVIAYLGYLGAVLSYADGIITSTQAVQDEITKIAVRLGISRPPGKVSWLGSNLCREVSDEGDIDAEILANLKGKKFVLSVGTIELRKNHRLLLDAFEEGLFEKDVSLVLVGLGEGNTATLQNKINESPYAGKQFFWFDRVDDNTLSWFYAHAYLVGISTFEEGSCLSVVEALQQGAPVLAADIPVIREVGRDFCEYFASNDDKSFVDKVVELLEHEEKYMALKRHTTEFEAFTWGETAANIIRAVNEIPFRESSLSLSESQADYENYRAGYARSHGLSPAITLGKRDGYIDFVLPEYGLFPWREKLYFELEFNFPKEEKIRLYYQLLDKTESETYPFGKSIWREAEIDCEFGSCEMSLDATDAANRAVLMLKVDYEGDIFYGRLPISFISKESKLPVGEVMSAYRYLLGRKPSQRELWQALYENEKPEELRSFLLTNPEFIQACGR